MSRQIISSGGPWEAVVGYSRAVRIGNTVAVSGTTSANPDGTIHGVGDPYEQARRCFEIIERALAEAEAALSDVIRTRMYVIDISHWEEVSRAHAEFFAEVRPAATMVQVSALMTPEILVEIEVDAVLAG